MVPKKIQKPLTTSAKGNEEDSSTKSNVRETSASFFRDALQEDTDIVCDAQKIADDIETEIYLMFNTDNSKQYRDKINSIKMKLKVKQIKI